MRILLLGKCGQLGWELNRTLITLGELIALDFPQLDLTKVKALQRSVHEIQPHLIVNAAAYTAVDKAENQVQLAMAINGTAPGVLAETARQLGAAFIHYSTDYVFDGTKDTPYIETDTPNPISVYGHSKWLGEQAIEQVGGNYLILRSSWMYSLRRTNYLKKVLEWARSKSILRIVSDQVGNPTAARMLAEATSQMLLCGGKDIIGWCAQNCGIYHVAGDGYASRFEFTKTILQYDPLPEEHIFVDIQSASTDEFPLPARRPQFSALDCEKFKRTFNISLPPWQEALKLVMEEIPRK